MKMKFMTMNISDVAQWHLAHIHQHLVMVESKISVFFYAFVVYFNLEHYEFIGIDVLNLIHMEWRWDIEKIFSIFAQLADEQNFNMC